MAELERLTLRVEADLAPLTRALDRAASAQAGFANELARGGARIEESLDGTEALAGAARDLGTAFAGAFTDALIEGEKLSELLRGLERDLLRLLTRRLVTRPLADAVTDLASGGAREGGALAAFLDPGGGLLAQLASLGAQVLHAGGEAGSADGARREVPAALFAGAPRFAGGGLVAGPPRLAPDEVPAILHRGETVRTPAQEAALARTLGQGPQVVFEPGAIQIQTPDPAAFEAARGQIEALLADAVRRGRRNR